MDTLSRELKCGMTIAKVQLNLGCSENADDDSETTFYLKTSFPQGF